MENVNLDCFGGADVPFGFPKNLLHKTYIRLHSYILQEARISTHPKVVWEDLTYPNVACFGAILETALIERKLPDEVTTVLRSRWEATIDSVS